ncbi:MAG: hypothetical protein EOO16_20990 [Chitinophagaceae bacterium]|nr:MAG: hypothetical protein EOO16_20990 [Chitinophagaceae bacterium]
MKKTAAFVLGALFLASCQQVGGWFGEKEKKDSTATVTAPAGAAALLRDESITPENAYSDLFLDSAAVEAYIGREKIDGDKAGRMRAFYRVRNNQFAWFSSDGPTEQARGLWSLYESKAGELKNRPPESLQERMDSLLTRDTSFIALRNGFTPNGPARPHAATSNDTASAYSDSAHLHSDPALIQTELALTAQFVNLAGEARSNISPDHLYWMVPRKKMDPLQLADSLLHKEQDSSMWRNNTRYSSLRNSLNTYYESARTGGWPAVSATGLKPGVRSATVVQLKKRLAATGDYPAGDTSDMYSDSLRTAVKAVQEQYGLRPTGLVTDSLQRALNVPAVERVQQILVNMNRALWLPAPADSGIYINIPSQELLAYSDSGAALRMPVIVGKEGSGTMAFSDRITTVVFNPYWNIPKSIVARQIKPAMDKDPKYLQKHHMEVVRQNDSLPQLRQLPGNDNALGRVKFLFPNSFDIYLHDTPHKELFGQRNRALSNGCIRVAQPDTLAAYVLRGQAGWTPEKIAAAMKGDKEQQVAVQQPVPVSISYYTAWPAANGKLHFRNDIYGYDRQTTSRMFLPAATAARM